MSELRSSRSDRSQSAVDLLGLYEITRADLAKIRKLGESVIPKLDDRIARFYDWLEKQPEYEEFFTSREKVEQVKALQVAYWRDFFRGEVDQGYIERRRAVGEVHAHIGLPLPTYFAAMNLMLELYSASVREQGLSVEDEAATIRALAKQLHLDTALVVETFSRITSETIAEQSRSLIAMSTPVTAIWRDVLLLPIVGVVDSKRAQEIMTAMLSKIAETESRVIILDIGGVAVVDTAVANHLIKITKATKIMGCECTISGVKPAIAQTIVELGVDVDEVRTTATLRDAVKNAFDALGYSLTERR